MKWKRYDYRHDISSAGLMRFRVDTTTRKRGELLTPVIRNNGSAVYNITKSGKSQKVSIRKAVYGKFFRSRVFGEAWVDKIAIYAETYNRILKQGFYIPKSNPGELPMWDHEKQSDIWLTYVADWCIGHATDSQLTPMG